ncbi:hypothetical protein A3D11_03700 [Candidatus Peribacteria bacterium RIFCSPHIGHO2_02_FULL_49_16]|nr:MAG: hypothetical protein A2880_04660 [Candidatus Peribacteria bacterium RIFCSPHIGHO2_01_FULL_49_38]OGJ58838.1 MAG: hypothetical protein A3D11_03700 [Candidatus Peribacteria bacterium RIFCSPHIGHO2_02_FULL_49_16]
MLHVVMRKNRSSLCRHLPFLFLFGVVMVGVWLLPALLAGMPYDIPPLLAVRNFAATGMFSMTDALGRFLTPEMLLDLGVPYANDSRLSIALFGVFARWVPFSSILGWTFLPALVLAFALVFLWLTAYKAFSPKTAWIAIILFALMPMYWREAVWLNHYQFAFLFLFASFAVYALLREKNEWIALISSGLLFGACIASKDVFLIFLPWFIGMYAWHHRVQWKQALPKAFIYSLCAGIMYLAPYAGDIRDLGYPVNQNLARIWPGNNEIQDAFYLHLYPDPYTYFFDRERFDAAFLERMADMSPLERMQIQKIRINFDVGHPGVFEKLLTGGWLFFGSIPSYFLQETLGGAFLWLFILPGIICVWKKNRFLAISLLGIPVFTETVIRFVFYFARDHLMDTGWIFALFAAVGIGWFAEEITRGRKRWITHAASILAIFFVSLQLVQANRVRFAKAYARPLIADTLALSDSLLQLPADSVVAFPLPPIRLEQIGTIGNRSVVLFAEETVERLVAEKKLRDVFEKYGVTHAARYSDILSVTVKRAIPSLQILDIPPIGPKSPEVTPFMRYLLHQVR